MEIAESYEDLGTYEFDLILRESLLDTQMIENVSSLNILQEEVDS